MNVAFFSERVSYQLQQFNFSVNEWIADKGYERGPTYHDLREQSIRASIPLPNDNLGQGKLSRGEFVYDRKQDRYRCPQDHYLYSYEKIDGRSTKRYRMMGRHCQSCSLKNACLPDNYTHRARFIYRGLYQDEIDRIKKRQKSFHFKQNVSKAARRCGISRSTLYHYLASLSNVFESLMTATIPIKQLPSCVSSKSG